MVRSILLGLFFSLGTGALAQGQFTRSESEIGSVLVHGYGSDSWQDSFYDHSSNHIGNYSARYDHFEEHQQSDPLLPWWYAASENHGRLEYQIYSPRKGLNRIVATSNFTQWYHLVDSVQANNSYAWVEIYFEILKATRYHIIGNVSQTGNASGSNISLHQKNAFGWFDTTVQYNAGSVDSWGELQPGKYYVRGWLSTQAIVDNLTAGSNFYLDFRIGVVPHR